MRKALVVVLVANILIGFGAFSFFALYAQFVLDYSLENLKVALEASQEGGMTGRGNGFLRPSLESMAIEEISRRDADLKTAILLDDAAHSMQNEISQSSGARAQIFLAEVLKEKIEHRNFLLRVLDSVYYFFRYLSKRFHPTPEAPPPLERVSALILNEADRMEVKGRLEEAERYYREFLDRFPDRPERGFVEISLAHVLMKRGQLNEVRDRLKRVQREFPSTREEIVAGSLLQRLDMVEKRLGQVAQLENWIRDHPDKIFSEEGGLELALGYLATYQVNRSITLLQKLSESRDPRLRTKALFYLGWIYQWQGDLDKGRELFEMLNATVSSPPVK